MKYRFLITGVSSGIGKYLLKHLPDSQGLTRSNFQDIEQHSYDVIIHCAFNKGREISDDRQYIEDNLFLTRKIMERLSFKSIVYLSSVDIYAETPTPYSLCKRFSEALIADCQNHTILRCATFLGPYMKPNHLTKLRSNTRAIGLSGDSSFNYVLYQDLLQYILGNETNLHVGDTIDFVSTKNVSLEQVRQLLDSSTQLGDARYTAPQDYPNPIFHSNPLFEKSSMDNLRLFLAEGSYQT